MGMWKQLCQKWFGLSDAPCETCELLREQLHKSDAERKELLHRLLEPAKVEPPSTVHEEFQPVTPQFTPWRVRQQLLEQEDRKKAQLMRSAAETARGMRNEHTEQIDKLEEELGVK